MTVKWIIYLKPLYVWQIKILGKDILVKQIFQKAKLYPLDHLHQLFKIQEVRKEENQCLNFPLDLCHHNLQDKLNLDNQLISKTLIFTKSEYKKIEEKSHFLDKVFVRLMNLKDMRNKKFTLEKKLFLNKT